MRSHCLNWACMGVLMLTGLPGACEEVVSAPARQALPRYASVLDVAKDSRLAQRVSVTAHHTTVGRLLEELSRQTGVGLRAGSDAVRAEPVQTLAREWPLQSLLRLLAEEFRWGPQRRYGWQWTRRVRAAVPEYVLVQDLATRQEPLRLREQDRAWFAEDLEEVARSFRKAERAGLGVVGEEVIQALPAAVRAAALQGRHVAIPSAEFTPQLRQMALTFLGPNGGPSEAARVEVYLEGEGDHLTLTTLFMEAGRGGSGSRFQPRRYLRRFSGDGAIRPNISVSGRPSVPRSYQGLAALPLNLNEEEAKRWRAVRTMPELLQLLHDRTGAGFVCDDYDYGVYWGAATRTPAGEPLGYWLDALVESVRTSRRLDGCRLEWREVDGCLLLRNPGWYADDALRPPADVTAWLVEARAVQPGRVLTISEAAGLLARLDVHQRATLARSGLLPKERLAGVGAVARLLEIVNSAQRAKLFSPGGLKVSQLSPHQRQLATAEGPGLTPVYSQWVLENQQGGELTLVLKQMEEGYRRRMECPARGPVEFSVQLRLPEENPEVCRVRVVEAQGR